MKLSRLALGAAFALMFAAPAAAADLGGNCCADLEERVAELEATTARKGNRKMSVVVYGQIDKTMLWHNSGGTDHRGIVDNANAPTLLGVRGEGKISPTWKAGFVAEFGVDNLGLPGDVSEIVTRQANLWIEGPVGRVTLGKGSMATDGAGEVSVANTVVAARMLSLGALSGTNILGADLPYDGTRRQMLRYDTPTMSGFMASASWSSDNSVFGPIQTEAWDLALRYAGELGGFRIAAAAGYRRENWNPTAVTDVSWDTMVASASVMHIDSGLFVNGAYGKVNNGPLVIPTGPFSIVAPAILTALMDNSAWHLQGGIEKNPFGVGKLTFYGEYAKLDAGAVNPNLWGIGAVQAIDAAATDLFVSFRRYGDIDLSSPQGIGSAQPVGTNVFMLGARVKF